MNNTVHATEEDPRATRGHALESMLRAERWSARQVALKIGTSPTSVTARFRGDVDLTFTDIERIAPLLKMSAGELFDALHSADQSGGGMKPAGWWFESTSGSNDHDDVATPQHDERADVLPLLPRTTRTAPERSKLAIVSTLKPSA